MPARELLIDTFVHIPPVRAIEALDPQDAERVLNGATHSIAQIVAHMHFWQTWFTSRCEGKGEPMVSKAADGWPAVARGSWPDLERQFVGGLERLALIGEDEDRLGAAISPAIEFPPLAQYTTRDVLVHVAHHNAHHLGQIILLRQMMRLWPPPAGSWTW